jgi:hypothetical protein
MRKFAILFDGLFIGLFLGLFVSGPAMAQKTLPGGADYQEGWIIKKTKDGIIKIPKKQGFVFQGSEVEAEANSPATSTFGTRPDRDRLSLIPVRKSFRKEAMSASGLLER